MKAIFPLVFGFDIDGVLTNDDDGEKNLWLAAAGDYFSKPVLKNCYSLREALDLSPEESRRFREHKSESIFESVPIRPHSAAILEHLNNLGITIRLITAREECFRAVTAKWLQKHAVPYHSLHMHTPAKAYSKGSICLQLGVKFFVDDRLENAEDVAQHGIYTLLYNASHNRGRTTAVPRVQNWSEIRDHINRFLQTFKEQAL